MRVVIDTNLFIAGFFNRHSFSYEIIKLAKAGKIDIVWTDPILKEIKFIAKNVKADKFLLALSDIFQEKNKVRKYKRLNIIKDDPADNKFLEAAVYGRADLIISSDKHLLKLKKFKDILIVSPKQAKKIIFSS